MRTGRLFWARGAVLGILVGPVGAFAGTQPVRFGVLPLQSPVALARLFIPLCARLAKALHRPIVFATAPDFHRFMARAKRGRYDILFLNPYLYRQLHGYRAVARIKGVPFVGLLITSQGRPIGPLTRQSLAGRTIAFPDPDAFAATLMVKEYLREDGVIVDTEMRPVYLRSQDSVILAVARGLVDFGGTWPWSLDQEPPAIRAEVRIVARTPPGPEMPIVVRDDMPPAMVKALQKALTGLTHSTAGRAILRRLRLPAGFAIANPGEYANIPRVLNCCAGPLKP